MFSFLQKKFGKKTIALHHMYGYRGIRGGGGKNIKCSRGCKKFPIMPFRSHIPTYGVIRTLTLSDGCVICESLGVDDFDCENDSVLDEVVGSFM